MLGPGDTLDGRYRLDRPLARGGFATVYLATHLRLSRIIAVKVLDPALLGGADHRDFLARFEREAATIAQLDHPNILGVHDFGEAEGTAYLVMPYVPGGTLADRIRSGPLPIERALPYLHQAAAALDYAHSRGLVHRDVKPQNMLLAADGERLLLADFGIARLLEGTSTQASLIVGTVAYMAPEQLDGRVSRASDIYALGCVFYELLTGTVPYSGTLHQVINGHLNLPIPNIANNPALAPFQPTLERALAKLPAARFETANNLAISLLAAHSAAAAPDVSTHPPLPEQAGVGEVDAQTRDRDSVGESRDGSPHEDQPHSPPNSAASGRSSSVTPPPFAVNDLNQLHQARPLRHAFFDSIDTSDSIDTTDNTVHASPLPRSHWSYNKPLWIVVGLIAVIVLIATVASQTKRPAHVTNPKAFDAITFDAPTIAAIAAAAPRNVNTLGGHTERIYDVAWSPDGRTLASGSWDETIRLWTSDGSPVATLTGHSSTVVSLDWSPDSHLLASGSWDNSVRIWTGDGVPVATLLGHTKAVNVVTWSPDGQVLASASDDSTVHLWRSDGSSLATLNGHTRDVTALAWSPDGRILASASIDNTVRLWDVNGNLIKALSGHTSGVGIVAWSPDGQLLASGSSDTTIRLWSPDGRPIRTLVGHSSHILDIAWSPDSRALTSVSNDGSLLIWSPDGSRTSLTSTTVKVVDEVAWSPDGRIIAAGSDTKAVVLWAANGTSLIDLFSDTDVIPTLAWSPDGRTLAAGTKDGKVLLLR